MNNKMIEKLKMKKEKLISQYDKIQLLKKNEIIKNECDLYGDDGPNLLFPLLLKKNGYLLQSTDLKDFSKSKIKSKQFFNLFIRKFGYLFLKTKQEFEDRNFLSGENEKYFDSLNSIDSPVIFVANHAFRDDILGTMIAAKRPAYVMFASLPQFYNTIDGVLLQKNGVVLINRKIKNSRKASLEKSKMVLQNGGNLIIFPEGVWNKSPNKLTLPLWNGFYRIAKEAGAKVVPVIHYISDPTYSIPKENNSFHTVVDDAIDVSKYTEEEVLEKVKTSFSTWEFLMMERYGKTSRTDLLDGYDNSQDSWADKLRKRTKTADKYDFEIETTADFQPKNILSPYDVFSSIAELNISPQNEEEVIAAKTLVKEYNENDFQHRF